MKDQFGESPNRDSFIRAGLKRIKDNDKNILIMIDAGPRHYIVDELIKLLRFKELHICLFDAYRPEYDEVLDKYDGKFYKGNTFLLDGTDFYKRNYPDEITRDFILNRELWYYCSKNI